MAKSAVFTYERKCESVFAEMLRLKDAVESDFAKALGIREESAKDVLLERTIKIRHDDPSVIQIVIPLTDREDRRMLEISKHD